MDIGIVVFVVMFALGLSVACVARVRALERHVAVLKRHMKITDMDLLSPETRSMIGHAEVKQIRKAIIKELSITEEAADDLIEKINGENDT